MKKKTTQHVQGIFEQVNFVTCVNGQLRRMWRFIYELRCFWFINYVRLLFFLLFVPLYALGVLYYSSFSLLIFFRSRSRPSQSAFDSALTGSVIIDLTFKRTQRVKKRIINMYFFLFFHFDSAEKCETAIKVRQVFEFHANGLKRGEIIGSKSFKCKKKIRFNLFIDYSRYRPFVMSITQL